ncbi:hypothetical protein Hte_003877 [Hypoxylon texense]
MDGHAEPQGDTTLPEMTLSELSMFVQNAMKDPPERGDDEKTEPDAARAAILALLPEDLRTTGEQAVHYLRIGNLRYAERFFSYIEYQLPETCGLPLKLAIRLQLASITLYLGKHEKAKDGLEAIKRDIETFVPITERDEASKTEYDFHCRRLLAIHMLHTGQWIHALYAFHQLLNPEWDAPSEEYSFKICRDLALAYAQLGEYESARVYIDEARAGLLFKKSSSSASEEHGLNIRYLVVGIVEATIDMLEGNYLRAIQNVSRYLIGFQKDLSVEHFRALSAANLRARCIVLQGKFPVEEGSVYPRRSLRDVKVYPHRSLWDVEEYCRMTFDSLHRDLGNDHPLTLDTMENLVRIWICQGRLVEAFSAVNVLYSVVVHILGERHSQAIVCKSLLAAIYFAQGKYLDALKEYKQVYKDATEILGPDHPKTVKYSCELARAHLYSYGPTEEAQAWATYGAAQQLKHINEDDLPPRSIHDIMSLTEELRIYVARGPSYLLELHPDSVYTIQLLAEIEVRKHRSTDFEGNLDIAEQILAILAEFLLFSHGKPSLLNASVGHDLAIVLRESCYTNSHPRSDEYMEILEKVFRSRQTMLGTDHPDVLRTYRELLWSRFIRDISIAGEASEYSVGWGRFISAAEDTWAALESRYEPKRFHEILYARIWRFVTRYVLGRFLEREMEEEDQSIGRTATSPQLVSEDLIRSMSAECLVEFGLPPSVLELSEDSVERDIESALKACDNESLDRALLRLEGDVERLKSSCVETSAKELDEEDEEKMDIHDFLDWLLSLG